MFLRNYWYVAAAAEELGSRLIQRWILNEPVLLYRTSAGRCVAMQDICPHRSYPLSKGTRIGDRVECGYHGLQFDPTGACVHVPAQGSAPRGSAVRTYRLVEKWRWVWIWMGDDALADERLIPDMHWNDDPSWYPVNGHLYIKCHYQLLADNLLDLSHEAFVHKSTIGNAAVAENPVESRVEGDLVVVERLMPGCPAPPLYQKLRGYDGPINRSHRIEFRPPANIVIHSKSEPVGSNDPARALRYVVLNAITPATETATHHFWGVPRDFAPEPEITEIMQKGSERAFGEDVGVLEDQQAMIGHLGADPPWVNIRADAGGIQARRIVDRLAAEERRGGGR